MEATLNPYLTLCTEEGSATEQKIAARVQTAIEKGGECIYNVNNGETYGLPRILPLKECINEIPEGEHFTGWVGYEKITMIDLALSSKNNNAGIDVVTKAMVDTLSEETRHMIVEQHDDFFSDNDCTSVAIRVDNPDGTWFEYIINETV